MDAEIAASSVMNDMLDAEASLDTLFLTGPQPRMSRDAPDPGPALRPDTSPSTMESLSDERQEKVQMLMVLTGIDDVDARVILQENSWQLEPDNARDRGMMLLAEKMNNPLLTLSAEESIDVTLAGIQCGLRAKEQMVKGQELLAIVGNTGVGKSLLVNYIHGCTVERVDRVMRVSESSPCKEITTVGHSNKSMTFIPQLAADEDFVYLDCPGFLDNRGPEISISNAVNIKSIVTNSSGVRVIMLINYNSLKSDRGAGLTEALKLLKSLFGDSLLGACDSILLGVTHVPLHDAEGDEETTLEDVGRLFQDTPNVADEMAQVLGRLVQRLFIYHPMNRGHSSWLKRDELIQTINALPPIRDPLKTFHTVLSLTDCEFLRNTVKALKDRSLDAMKEDRFVDVRECMQYMDSMEVVQHDLASNIINEAKAEASRCLQGLADKIWEHSSHWRFDEAKTFLDRLAQAAKDLQPHPLGGEAERLHSTAAQRLEASLREKERSDREKSDLVRALVNRSVGPVPRRICDAPGCNNTARRACPHRLCGRCCATCSYSRERECKDCDNRAAGDCPLNLCGCCCDWDGCPRHG